MKKSLFVLGVAVAALASCTNEEVVDVADSNLIKFDNVFVGNNTRASVTQTTTDAIKNFYVYATKNSDNAFFNNVKVYESSVPNVWVYDDLKQWEAATYAFAAYSNGGNAADTDGKIDNVSWDGTKLTFTDYSVDYADQRDFVASISASQLNAANTPVAFKFAHTLAMVKFTLKSTLGDGDNKITISDFKVTGAKNKATLDFNASGCTWGTPSEAVTLNNAASFESTTSVPGESDEFVVIPQTASLEVAFTAAIDGMQEKNLKATIANTTWQPGFRYNYVATIDGGDMEIIEFADPTVTPWDDTNWDVEDAIEAGEVVAQ